MRFQRSLQLVFKEGKDCCFEELGGKCSLAQCFRVCTCSFNIPPGSTEAESLHTDIVDYPFEKSVIGLDVPQQQQSCEYGLCGCRAIDQQRAIATASSHHSTVRHAYCTLKKSTVTSATISQPIQSVTQQSLSAQPLRRRLQYSVDCSLGLHCLACV